jgi:hypothetical protein
MTVVSGVLEGRCAALLKAFFASRRQEQKTGTK